MFYQLAEQLFVMCALFFYTGALAPFISDENILAGPKQSLPILCSLVTLILIVIHWGKILPVIFRAKTLWLLLLLTLFSISWSAIPEQTWLLVIPLLRVSLFGLYFSTRFTLREQLQMLVLVFGAAAIGSVILAALLPTYGVMGVGFIANSQDTTHTGAWRGLFIHKTILGSMMIVTGLLCWVNLLRSKDLRKRENEKNEEFLVSDRPSNLLEKLALSRFLSVLYRFGIFISVVGLWMSTTKGAILVVMIAIVLIPFYKSMRWSYFKLIPFSLISLMTGTALFTILINHAEQILGLIGREVTISGRTIYWPIMWNEIQEKFWLGYGYESFWREGWRGQVGNVWMFLLPGNEPPHAHNGYLMIWFDIGLVGLLLFGLNFVCGYINALRFIRLEKTEIGLVPITYLTITLLFNLTESFIMRPDIFWILYMSSILSVHRERQLASHKIKMIYGGDHYNICSEPMSN